LLEPLATVGLFGASFAVAAALVPYCVRIATRFGLCDHPGGRKRHARATPYLGGVAIVGGALVAASPPLADVEHYAILVVASLLLGAVGTLDDRTPLPVSPRLGAEACAGLLLWSAGAGWSLFEVGVADAALTAVWIVVVVNAFNMSDNLDGAAASTAAVVAAGAASMAILLGEPGLVPLSLTVAGACAGFLCFNLSAPSRIFMGDGGSMPLGLLLAALTMGVSQRATDEASAGLIAAALVGLPLLDMAFVLWSRWRRGVPICTAGTDHLSHSLLSRLQTPRRVAVALATVQAALSACAISTTALPQMQAVSAAALSLAMMASMLVWLQPRRLGATARVTP
jgi:UDP-N-acetylmuramyl pentapeptide phosphotransferase/UDP-N-acetylglucosamine-1-phosphate transferase